MSVVYSFQKHSFNVIFVGKLTFKGSIYESCRLFDVYIDSVFKSGHFTYSKFLLNISCVDIKIKGNIAIVHKTSSLCICKDKLVICNVCKHKWKSDRWHYNLVKHTDLDTKSKAVHSWDVISWCKCCWYANIKTLLMYIVLRLLILLVWSITLTASCYIIAISFNGWNNDILFKYWNFRPDY